jgi:hypothetical protein
LRHWINLEPRKNKPVPSSSEPPDPRQLAIEVAS